MTVNLELERLVTQLVNAGVPRDRAEARAREEFGLKTQLEELRDEADAEALEDEIVEEGDRMMKALGFFVIRLSQKRAAKITAGVPDRRYYHADRRIVLWWEAKAAWGRQRPDQRVFQELCDKVGDPYVLGGLEELRTWLYLNRVASFDARGLPHPIPREST